MSYFNKKNYDVVFYYPQHFNRSTNAENEFFEPLIAVCKLEGLNYLVIEEPDKATGMKRNMETYKFDYWFKIISILRRLLLIKFIKNFSHIDCFIGKIISYVSFNKFRANNYITISNSMINVLSGLNSKANVFDLQHGVIYCEHEGYFKMGGKLRDDLLNERICFLTYGDGFRKEFLIENNEEYDILERVKIIGNVLGNKNIQTYERNLRFDKVVYSLQFVASSSLEFLETQKMELITLLDSIKDIFIDNNIILYLKHHPRFNNVIPFEDVMEKFQFVKLTTDSIDVLCQQVCIHITENSTTAFDFSAYGIPTFFTYSNTISQKEHLFRDHYKYPCLYDSFSEMILTYLKDNNKLLEDSLLIKEWHKNFYSPFDPVLFINLLSINKK